MSYVAKSSVCLVSLFLTFVWRVLLVLMESYVIIGQCFTAPDLNCFSDESGSEQCEFLANVENSCCYVNS